MTALPTSDLDYFLGTTDGARMVEEFAGEGGACCLIHDPVEFLLRFQNHESSDIRFGLVSYSGNIFGIRDAFDCIDAVPFTKSRRFSYQHEFRVITKHPCQEHYHYEDLPGHPHEPVYEGIYEPYDIKLGGLADIASIKTFG
jgi:hypothetical protein